MSDANGEIAPYSSEWYERQAARQAVVGVLGNRIVELATIKATYIAAETKLLGAADATTGIHEAARDCVAALAAVHLTPLAHDPEVRFLHDWLEVVQPSWID